MYSYLVTLLKQVLSVKGTDGCGYPHVPILCPFTPKKMFLGVWPPKWGAKFAKMGDSLLRMPMYQRAKFDAASFILTGEIRNCTNKQKTQKQRVNDISTPCLLACVDNNNIDARIFGSNTVLWMQHLEMHGSWKVMVTCCLRRVMVWQMSDYRGWMHSHFAHVSCLLCWCR